MIEPSQLNSLQMENEVLRALALERGKALFEALSALSDMWNQYCPPKWTHQNMSAGEVAEEILRKWQLMRDDESSIYIDGMVIDDDIPEIVLALRELP